jgi:uncharacterized protein (TIGR02598 family)
MKTTPRFPASQKAFTLVEVTMAIGISSFAILSMLGVLAVGMKTMRGAIDTTVQAQITQDVVGTLKQADFSTLSNASSWAWKYDDRGVAVQNEAAKVYGASVELAPVSLSGGNANPNLLKVIVSINNLTEPGNPHVFSTFISNNGQ